MTRNTTFHLSPLAGACLLAWAALPASTALAQSAPDAGRVLQEQASPALQAPRPAAGLRLITPPIEPTLPGGARITLQAVRLSGNTVLSESQLLSALGAVSGQSFDMAGLRALAEQVATAYHDAGYPFARAYLPPQDLSSGQLVIAVVEGRYGAVQATGDAALAAQAQGFLSRLQPGAPIESRSLERATLILDDQPGVRTVTVMRPGTAFGTGDLDVEVIRTPRLHGDMGYDNHGSRYTGEHRLRANVLIDSPFRLGDQVQLSGVTTSESLWLGSLGYSRPLGTDGWRGQVSYAHTRYQLGQEFANAQASGIAKVATLAVTYPWVRSQAVNLTLGVTLQHKDLQDTQGAAGTRSGKTSDAAPLSLQFDQRDSLAAGGVSYGSVSVTPGRLKLGTELKDADARSSVNSNGHFSKWNMDVARSQNTGVAGLSLFGRLSGQWTNKNLDSSEKFGLGGASGVRAYPTGEGFGDTGWLTQLEVRYAVGDFSPYAFYDAGSVRLHAKVGDMTPAPLSNRRSVAGAGLGARYTQGPWSVDASLAWRTQGGRPEADTTVRNPRGWVTVSYRL